MPVRHSVPGILRGIHIPADQSGRIRAKRIGASGIPPAVNQTAQALIAGSGDECERRRALSCAGYINRFAGLEESWAHLNDIGPAEKPGSPAPKGSSFEAGRIENPSDSHEDRTAKEQDRAGDPDEGQAREVSRVQRKSASKHPYNETKEKHAERQGDHHPPGPGLGGDEFASLGIGGAVLIPSPAFPVVGAAEQDDERGCKHPSDYPVD